MMNIDRKQTTQLYQSGEYFEKHPSLHTEDSEWKFSKIKKILNDLSSGRVGDEIHILDIGGGAGQILDKVAKYLNNVHRKKVYKYALDICPRMLDKHKKTNPDLCEIYNEDISSTTILDQKMDIALVVDVLEHIPKPVKALREIKRIAKYAIFKVPLENNLYSNLYNLLKRGKPREFAIKNLGHINVYNAKKLLKEIETNIGPIISCDYTNVYNYYLNDKFYKHKLPKLDKNLYLIANRIFEFSPEFASLLLTDFLIVLTKCN